MDQLKFQLNFEEIEEFAKINTKKFDQRKMKSFCKLNKKPPTNTRYIKKYILGKNCVKITKYQYYLIIQISYKWKKTPKLSNLLEFIILAH